MPTYLQDYFNNGMPNGVNRIYDYNNMKPYVQTTKTQELAPWYKENQNLSTTDNFKVFEGTKVFENKPLGGYPARQFPLYYQEKHFYDLRK